MQEKPCAYPTNATKLRRKGLLIETGMLRLWLQATIRIINNERLRFRLRKNALDYADEFSWDKGAQEFLEILERVWRCDEEARLSRFYLTLNIFGTFVILRLSDLGDGYE